VHGRSPSGVGIVEAMKLDVYRSCTWREKRDVLNAFWRANVDSTPRISEAALQYGHYAVICMAVIILEVALVIAVSIAHRSAFAVVAAALEVFVLLSTRWAVLRYRTLKAVSAR
jgi:hypothetical protein